MLTLAFDTSSRTLSVAVLSDEKLLYEVVANTGANHSEVLLPAMDEACRNVKHSLSEFDLLCCTVGPGSFTGLRIGISTLKGIMLSTGKPAVVVSSLAALAMNAGRTNKIIYPVIDAGRGQIYTAGYLYDGDSLKQQKTEMAGNPIDIFQHQEKDSVFLGDGAVKYSDSIEGKNNCIVMRSAQHDIIHGYNVGLLGLKKYRCFGGADVSALSPLYLRCADAIPARPLFD
ncbi:MAG: tRNA (adenosine(37)-N6)-threonylcarbamoyltransferase complex dimerization subunit type 1 TsaB [Smithellaceae bacterium]